MKDPNVYHFSTYVEDIGAFKPETYTPPQGAIAAMNKIRRFIEQNKLPMEIYPISGRRINLMVNKNITDPEERILCKVIMNLTGMTRRANIIYAPRAIIYQAQDNWELESQFNLEDIKTEYLKKSKDESKNFIATWGRLTGNL